MMHNERLLLIRFKKQAWLRSYLITQRKQGALEEILLSGADIDLS